MDNVAEIDANADQHPTLGGNLEIALSHDLLDCDGAFDRPHGARKLRHDAVAGYIDNSSAVPYDGWEQDHLVRFEVAHRLFFVAPHQAGVASDVRGQNGREAPLVNVGLRHLGHGVFHAVRANWREPAPTRYTLRAFEPPQWVALPTSVFQVLYI